MSEWHDTLQRAYKYNAASGLPCEPASNHGCPLQTTQMFRILGYYMCRIGDQVRTYSSVTILRTLVPAASPRRTMNVM